MAAACKVCGENIDNCSCPGDSGDSEGISEKTSLKITPKTILGTEKSQSGRTETQEVPFK